LYVVRLQLNKQIQQLDGYLRARSVDEERQRSHYSASTAATRSFQYETPETATVRTSMRCDAQVNLHNEAGGYERWNSSSVSFSSVERFGVSSGPMEREPYIPKYAEVNYIEGSNDEKWSSGNFPWTKKLEVLI
jgi:bloom syndrome protein